MRFGSALVANALAVWVTALGVPALADEPTPPAYYDPSAYPPPSARWGLIGAGFATTAVWYGLAFGFSELWPDAPGADDLKVPVAGPWMALADTGCAADEPDCSIFTVVLRAVLTTMDGVGQAGGLLVVGEGVFLSTVEPAPGPTPRRRLRLERQESQLRVAPIVTRGGAMGIGLRGSF